MTDEQFMKMIEEFEKITALLTRIERNTSETKDFTSSVEDYSIATNELLEKVIKEIATVKE